MDFVMAHGADKEDELFASYDENIMLYHSAEQEEKKVTDGEQTKETTKQENGKTIKEILDTLTDEQKDAVYAMVGMIGGAADDDDKEDNEDMKHSIFDQGNTQQQTNVLSHSDEIDIINMAKKSWKSETGHGNFR